MPNFPAFSKLEELYAFRWAVQEEDLPGAELAPRAAPVSLYTSHRTGCRGRSRSPSHLLPSSFPNSYSAKLLRVRTAAASPCPLPVSSSNLHLSMSQNQENQYVKKFLSLTSWQLLRPLIPTADASSAHPLCPAGAGAARMVLPSVQYTNESALP